VTDAPTLSRAECEALARRVLGLATADETKVEIQSIAHGNTRFARNRISTTGEATDTTLSVRSAFGKRSAEMTTNKLDGASLAALVKEVEALARLAPENPEAMPVLPPQSYPRVSRREIPMPGPADRAAAVKAVLGRSKAAGFDAAGFIEFAVGARAIATSRGLFAWEPVGGVGMSTTVRTPDGTGSGWAGATGDGWSAIDPSAIGARATEKAGSSRGPVAIEPGRYTVILEPDAAADLVRLLRDALDARSADEGRSFFARPGGGNKVGMKIVDDRVTLLSDPADARSALAEDGLPARRTPWIERGVLKNLGYGRYWAGRQGKPPTAAPDAIRMMGGSTSIPRMVATTERGILVTRCWYIRSLDPRTVLYTGLTRDGTFLIEDGKIARAVKNLRWNDSPAFLLNNLVVLGQTVRVHTGAGGSVYVPAMKCREFNCTSVSDAV
jgi:predicted Zn-dependent protease